MDFSIHAQQIAPYRVYFILFIFLGILTYTLPAAAQCTGGSCSVVLNAASSDYNVSTDGLTICIAGTHSKNITINNHTVTICIRSTANYSGNLSIGSSANVTINNYGTYSPTSSINYESGVAIHNYGTYSPGVGVGLNMKGTFTSYTNSTLTIPNSSTLNAGSTMVIQSGVTASFSGGLTVNGTLNTSSSFSVTSGMTNNSGGTINITNATISASGGISNNGTINLSNSILRASTGGFINNSGGLVRTIDATCSRVEVFGGASSTNSSGATFGNAAAGTGRTDICTKASAATPDASGTGFTSAPGTEVNFSTCSCSLMPLPVSFVYFKGEDTSNGVLLQWQTASEKDNSHFVVERSTNGTDFSAIAEIKGNGTLQGLSSYKTLDTQPLSQKTYYRLIQVDRDGTAHAYSKLIVINRNTTATRLYVTPNPSGSEGVVQLQFSQSVSKASVRVVDIQGKVQQQFSYTAPQAAYELPVQTLPKGVYLIMVQFTNDKETATQTQRFVKL